MLLLGLLGQDSPYDRGRFTLDVTNDDFGSDVDEAFTSAVEATIRVTPGNNVALSSLSPWLSARRVREYWSLSVGQEIYTPALLQETDLEVLQNDRRYAGWLYGGLKAELILRHSPFIANGYTLYTVEVVAGSTGPRTQTEPLQRYWHAFIRDVLNRRRLPEDPKGWGVYEVPNHWGVNISVDQQAEMLRWQAGEAGLRKAIGSDFGFRILSRVGARLGNMWVDGHISAMMQVGLLPEVVFDELSMPLSLTGRMFDVPLAVYGFVSGRLIGSVYNALLDGPPGATGPYPERNYVMTQLEAGFALRLAAVEFMFRHVTLSPDLANRPPGGVWVQNWGRITLSFAFY